MSTCFDACADAWPPLLVEEVNAEGRAQSALAGTFERRNGEEQATYGGWPLYYFVQDQAGAPRQGQDRHGFGGEWYLLRPDGTRVEG